MRASDEKLLETWTGATGAWGVLVAMSRIFATGDTSPGSLYQIDPGQAAGAVTTVASNLGATLLAISPSTAHASGRPTMANSVSIVTPGASIPWTVTTVATGFSFLSGVLYDGANVWVTDSSAGTLLKLDSAGAILQTVTVSGNPLIPVFDGTNIWVPTRLRLRLGYPGLERDGAADLDRQWNERPVLGRIRWSTRAGRE